MPRGKRPAASVITDAKYNRCLAMSENKDNIKVSIVLLSGSYATPRTMDENGKAVYKDVVHAGFLLDGFIYLRIPSMHTAYNVRLDVKQLPEWAKVANHNQGHAICTRCHHNVVKHDVILERVSQQGLHTAIVESAMAGRCLDCINKIISFNNYGSITLTFKPTQKSVVHCKHKTVNASALFVDGTVEKRFHCTNCKAPVRRLNPHSKIWVTTDANCREFVPKVIIGKVNLNDFW
jgi:hypothetical protein